MRSALLLACLATVAAGAWLGDEYWTLIGPSGQPIQGDASHFAKVAHYFKNTEHNRFVAYWMTNQHYPGRMFEQFGEAYLDEEKGKYCARFTGERAEAIETCSNFRILTVPARYAGRVIFEWVKVDAGSWEPADKVGFNDHVVCSFAYEPVQAGHLTTYTDFTFGNGVVSTGMVHAVNRRIGQPKAEYDNYLLRLLVGENLQQTHVPRLPSPPHQQHSSSSSGHHHQHQEGQQQHAHHHHQQQQEEQDREYQARLRAYHEQLRLRQQEEQQQRQQAASNLQQQQQQHVADSKYVCDTYGRVFEKVTKDERQVYQEYDVAANGGVRPPCVLIGESSSQPQQPQQQSQQQKKSGWAKMTNCGGRRQRRDGEGC